MPAEKFANLAETTLSAGYTAGAGSISVTSAAGFPTVGVFRVRLGNTGKTIFRVDSVSGTTFTGAAEANDANANSGDTAILAASKAVAERFVQSPEAGDIALLSGAAAVDRYGPLNKLGDPTLPSWAWQNQGGASVVQANGIVFLSLPNTAVNIRSRLIAAPATPYSMTALLRARYTSVAANAQFCGLIFRESGTSKLYIYGIQNGGSIQAIKYTNDTTFSAVGAVNLALPGVMGTQWHWLRVRDDGTNLIFSMSLDGVNFVQMGSEGRTVFMAGGPNQVGIFGDTEGSPGAFDVSFASWVQT